MFAIPWVAALIGGLVAASASFFGRALIAFGVSVVTYKGIDKLLDNLQKEIVMNVKDVPVEALQVMGLLKVDICISIIMSAFMARLVISGLTSGSMRKWVAK